MYNSILKVIGLLRFHIKLFLNKKIHYIGLKQHMGSFVHIRTDQQSIIKIGKALYISERCSIGAYHNSKLIIGDNNFFNSNCNIMCLAQISIGDNNLFGPNVVIIDHNHKYDDADKLICKQGYQYKPVFIGSDCWICANVVICPGAVISDHIIIAANSVVKGELREPGVYAGMPAKLIKLK